jgi:hypothetical protein
LTQRTKDLLLRNTALRQLSLLDYPKPQGEASDNDRFCFWPGVPRTAAQHSPATWEVRTCSLIW